MKTRSGLSSMRIAMALSMLLCAALLEASGAAGPQPWLFTGMAPQVWQGVALPNGVTAFKGLPFAEAPVGERRWRPPAPYVPTAVRRVAREFAAACMQGRHTVDWYQGLINSVQGDPSDFDHPAQGYSEDCLYLNVWTPARSSAERLPVMVWIHGGSNKGGWSFEPDYHGDKLAAEGVVVVSVAYRLGIFGFFSHPDLVTEQDGAGNYGLLDIVAALQWVQRYIGEFGGDPDAVTVFGESAGAANIGYLMSSRAAAGLFRRAIHQSGGFQMNANPTLDVQTTEGQALARHAGTGLSGLRGLSGEAVLELVEDALPGHEFSPAVGGHALPRSPAAVFAGGDQHDVSLMIGTNANEWLMYLQRDQQLRATIQELGLTEHSAVISERYADLSDALTMDRLITAEQMLCPSYVMASAVSLKGGHSWVYQLQRVRSGSRWQAQGAYHGAEIPYVFNSHAAWINTDQTDRALTGVVQKYWVNFATSGNPNRPGQSAPVWSKWNPSDPRVVALDMPVAMISAPDTWLCGLLEASKPLN